MNWDCPDMTELYLERITTFVWGFSDNIYTGHYTGHTVTWLLVTGPMNVKAARSRSQPRLVRLPGCRSLSAA